MKRSRGGNDGTRHPAEPCTEIVLDELVTPNFDELAHQFPEFRRAWREVEESRKISKEHGGPTSLAATLTQSFSIALTKALLHVHFGISLVRVPEEHLCPPVPNRFFFIRWIQRDLLPLLHSQECFPCYPGMMLAPPTNQRRIVLDIGTGPCCIYPLLMAASADRGQRQDREKFHILATDIDPAVVDHARENVRCNPFVAGCIEVRLVPPSSIQRAVIANTVKMVELDIFRPGPLQISMQHLPSEMLVVDVCLTNPPFFDTTSTERTDRRAGDQRARTNMTVSEGNYPGSEVAFVLDMLADGIRMFMDYCCDHSLVDNNNFTSSLTTTAATARTTRPPPNWCSCMCGKKDSWIQLKTILEQILGYAHLRVTEFGPGHMTRWFLAWTFRRPHIQSPLGRCIVWEFNIALTEEETHGMNCKTLVGSEVIQRIQSFCMEWGQRNGELMVTMDPIIPGPVSGVTSGQYHQTIVIQEKTPKTPSSNSGYGFMGDESLPDRFISILQCMSHATRTQFLPMEGHFQIVLEVRIMQGEKPAGGLTGKVNNDYDSRMENDPVSFESHPPHVQVNARGYCHTRYGKHQVEKIKLQMPGELCRTNRRWRRRLHSSVQQMNRAENPHESPNMCEMDTTTSSYSLHGM